MENCLKFEGVTKYFPGVKALSDISFSAFGGEVLAFLGENGAGKSTLLKIMSGDYEASEGKVLYNGEEKIFTCPKEAIEFGISVIYQERQVLPELTVAENIFLGRLPMRGGFVNTKKLVQDSQKIISEFGLDIDPNTKVKKLNVAHQQMVEIMKSYSREVKVIAFDEPTASLSDQEVESLFHIIKKLKSENKIILYVTHRMKELNLIADKVAVFKDGRYIATLLTKDTTEKELIKLMVGRELGDVFSVKEVFEKKEVLLSVNNLSSDYIQHIDFSLYKGEVLGFSGLVGAGRTEVIKALIGVDKKSSGKIIMEGKEVKIRSTKEALEVGIALIPEDRKVEGIIPNLSVGKNISISVIDRLKNKIGLINRKKERKVIEESIKAFNIKTPYPEKLIVELSGGNQQKVIVARWMYRKPKILILDEPTKGIDVGAKAEIYRLIEKVVKEGVSVIIISSELPEVIGLSDRIIVMKDGQITGMIEHKDATEDRLLELAMIERMGE